MVFPNYLMKAYTSISIFGVNILSLVFLKLICNQLYFWILYNTYFLATYLQLKFYIPYDINVSYKLFSLN